MVRDGFSPSDSTDVGAVWSSCIFQKESNNKTVFSGMKLSLEGRSDGNTKEFARMTGGKTTNKGYLQV